MLGKDVEDDGGAIDDAGLELVFEMALLTGREFPFGDDHVRLHALFHLDHILEAALAEVGTRVGPVAVLNDDVCNLDARRSKELRQLREPVSLILFSTRNRGDDEGALWGAVVGETAPLVLRPLGASTVGPLQFHGMHHRTDAPDVPPEPSTSRLRRFIARTTVAAGTSPVAVT